MTVLVGLACSEAAPRPNIIFVVIDTLRADRLGCYGNERGLTPFLDSLCTQGTVFANAYASSSWTMPSVASLLTSRYAIQHGVGIIEMGKRGSRLGDGEVTLAELLASSGYETAGFSANVLVSPRSGFHQGFETWAQVLGPDPKDRTVKPRGRFVSGRALRWEESRTRPEAPYFLYLHYMDPHSPYEPPELLRERFAPGAGEGRARSANDVLITFREDELSDDDVAMLEDLYDAEIASLDAELRRLFTLLEREGVFEEPTVVIVTSDHGEEFREHGRLLHGNTLYDTAVRVPLIVIAPGVAPARVARDPVSLMDLAPTVLELAGAPPEPRFEGRSLVPLFRKDAEAPPVPILLELPPKGEGGDLRHHEFGFVHGRQKLLGDVGGARFHFFDLAEDPDERTPAPAAQTPRARSLRRAFTAQVEAIESRIGSGNTAEFDADTEAELRALGYVR